MKSRTEPGVMRLHQALSWLQAGQVRISTEAATIEHLAHKFWHRILAMGDLDDDQQLSLEEFQGLIKVFVPHPMRCLQCHAVLCLLLNFPCFHAAADLDHSTMHSSAHHCRWDAWAQLRQPDDVTCAWARYTACTPGLQASHQCTHCGCP